MNLLGQPGGHVREPLLPVTDPNIIETLQTIIDRSGIAEATTHTAKEFAHVQ
jgi:4-hydroxy-tetrahydrodipicolinate synthase